MNGEEMKSRLKLLGADIAGINDRFMDDMELYELCLTKLLASNDFARLGQCIGEKDYETAFSIAHTLKGTIGNMGLIPLLSATSELVEALRAHDYSSIGAKYDKALRLHAELKKTFS